MTDAGFKTKSASSAAGSKSKKVLNEFALARMYQDRNIKVADILKSFDISPPVLYDRLTKMGIKTRQNAPAKGKRLNELTISKIHAMHAAGHTNYRIAKTLGVATATVSYHLKKGVVVDLTALQPVAVQATIVVRPPSLWSRIKGWFN